MTFTLPKMNRGFALDPLYLFFGVMILAITVILVSQLSIGFNTYSTGIVGHENVENFNTNFRDMDWVIPFFVGSACVAMLLYASLAGAVPISIILFMIIAIIVDIMIVYLNDFNVLYFDLSNAITPLNMPLTRFTLEWLPMILTIVLVLMGVLMHSRSNY